jgi:uncharacterized membrane protein YkvA (DUF1232 family)
MADILGREIKTWIERYLSDPPFRSEAGVADILKRVKVDFPQKTKGLRRKLGPVFCDLETFYEILFEQSFVVNKRTQKILTATLVFFLNPFEFLPKGIPLVGLVDDRLVIACAAQLCRSEINRFQAEKKQASE